MIDPNALCHTRRQMIAMIPTKIITMINSRREQVQTILFRSFNPILTSNSTFQSQGPFRLSRPTVVQKHAWTYFTFQSHELIQRPTFTSDSTFQKPGTGLEDYSDFEFYPSSAGTSLEVVVNFEFRLSKKRTILEVYIDVGSTFHSQELVWKLYCPEREYYRLGEPWGSIGLTVTPLILYIVGP